MRKLTRDEQLKREKIHRAVDDLLMASYDSGWFSGKIESLANNNIDVSEECRDEHLKTINRRNDKKALLIARIDDLFYGDKNE